jgi:hypothetical protein
MGSYFQICCMQFLFFGDDCGDFRFYFRNLRLGRCGFGAEPAREGGALENVFDPGDAGDVQIEFFVEVAIGLKLTQLGHVAADRAFGVVADAVDLGVLWIVRLLAVVETPCGADDLGYEDNFHGVYRPEPGFDVLRDVVVSGSEGELEGSHVDGSFRSVLD